MECICEVINTKEDENVNKKQHAGNYQYTNVREECKKKKKRKWLCHERETNVRIEKS